MPTDTHISLLKAMGYLYSSTEPNTHSYGEMDRFIKSQIKKVKLDANLIRRAEEELLGEEGSPRWKAYEKEMFKAYLQAEGGFKGAWGMFYFHRQSPPLACAEALLKVLETKP